MRFRCKVCGLIVRFPAGSRIVHALVCPKVDCRGELERLPDEAGKLHCPTCEQQLFAFLPAVWECLNPDCAERIRYASLRQR